MRFKRLYLQNFRPFVDEELTFSQESSHNVTVVHGQNGSGKTTLLDALRWGLFGNAAFENEPYRLPNQGKMAGTDPGGEVEVRIEIDFEHDSVDFELERFAVFEKQTERDFDGNTVDEGITLKEQSSSGHMESVSNPNNRVEQILPQRLSDLFLFDGEYIDRLSGTNEQGEIKSAIQNIMGLTVLERSIDHLKKVEGRFEETVKKYGSDQLQELIQQKQDLRDDIEDIEVKIEDKREFRNNLKQEIDEIDNRLEKIGDTAELQQHREQLEEQRLNLLSTKEEINNDIQSQISTKGYLPFAMGAIEETAKDIDRLREEGKIPSELDNQLVNDLLDDQTCICGRDLKPNTEYYQRVAGYKNDDTPDGVDNAAIQLITRIGLIQEDREEFFESVQKKVEQRKNIRDKIENVNEEIDELSTQISGTEGYNPETDESPQELESSRRQKIEKRATLKEQIDQHENEKELFEEDLEELKEEIDEAKEEVAEATLARKRMKATEHARRNIESSFQELQHTVRTWSNDRVKETFETVATKSSYVAEITDNFELKIREKYGGDEVEVNKSRGERQIASLAFIGSLVSIAKERNNKDSEKLYFSGGIYPIVMDSPFGALDKQHRREISRIIPQLADQVVVFATDSQWEGPVEEEMTDIIGEEYRIEYDDGSGEGSYPRSRIEKVREIPAGEK
ncbi:AAA family ATPase [Natronorubrum thiooxidans]|uniref:DNA sulfur modification protein DndD n=1 Tax=Natronorubrum thiooxidans TaxID=308853 RepID=A0A1N7GUH6_9EURY|nr:AAA family ATPase [Natronorubrum thiooxidans]SIS16204.1 DNA sulfur modification protein DndD [Natronorubrum thiooxidans]